MKIAIHISTKNRVSELKHTIEKLSTLISRNDVECIIFDDGSNDGTLEYLKKLPEAYTVLYNVKSKGYLYCRNQMLNTTKADYAISLDDDAHFLSDKVLENIYNHFEENPDCGLIAFRLFWGTEKPQSLYTNDVACQVSSYIGCGHVWRMTAWKSIPDYPEWFVFYGEENFASLHLFKKQWKVNYLPSVLVHHRVDMQKRKSNSDYDLRFIRSLSAGWNVIFLFYPSTKAIKHFSYSLWVKIKTKVFKGDFKASISILKALFDLLLNFSRIIRQRDALDMEEFKKYKSLNEAKVYWKPESKIN